MDAFQLLGELKSGDEFVCLQETRSLIDGIVTVTFEDEVTGVLTLKDPETGEIKTDPEGTMYLSPLTQVRKV